jgi:hypothetical protein
MGTPEFDMQRLAVDPKDPSLLHVPDWKGALREYGNTDEITFLWPFLKDRCTRPFDFVSVLVSVPVSRLQALPFDSGSIVDELVTRYTQSKLSSPKRAAMYAQLIAEAVSMGLKTLREPE